MPRVPKLATNGDLERAYIDAVGELLWVNAELSALREWVDVNCR